MAITNELQAALAPSSTGSSPVPWVSRTQQMQPGATPYAMYNRSKGAGDPRAFESALATRNLLVNAAMQNFQPGAGLPYSQSPYAGQGQQMGNALMQMLQRQAPSMEGYGGAATMQEPTQQAYGAQTALQRNLTMMEPERLSELMKLLTGIYGQGMGTAADVRGLQAAQRQQDLQGQGGIMRALSGIPIVGPAIAGGYGAGGAGGAIGGGLGALGLGALTGFMV